MGTRPFPCPRAVSQRRDALRCHQNSANYAFRWLKLFDARRHAKPCNNHRDAIGEIANMIAGNFKNKLSGMGDGCMLSVPTVITGSDYCCRSLSDTGPLEVTFGFEGAPIRVELEVHS